MRVASAAHSCVRVTWYDGEPSCVCCSGVPVSRPALLGGSPVRSHEHSWPVSDDGVRDVFERLAATGEWGQYLGPHCDALRERLAADMTHPSASPPHVRLCSGGTAAIWLALIACRVTSGDEVLLAAYDFKANLANIRELGATPVLVDVRPDDAQLDVDQLDAARTNATRAIIVSHLHGGSVQMPPVRDWADRHGVAVIEDICQNPLAGVDGRPAGCWGDVAALSFGGSKTLSAGRGGAVVMADDAMAARLTRFAERGNDVSPLSEMQAAVLLPQFDALPERAATRRRGAAWIGDRVASLGLRLFDSRRESCSPDYYKVGFWYDDDAWDGLSRERLCEAMHAEGITLSPGFPSLQTTHAKRTFRTVGDLPHAAAAGRQIVGLHHPVLLDEPHGWQQVVDALTKLHAARTLLREAG